MIVYFSGATGFTHRFVEKLELPALRIPQKIKEAQEFVVEDPYVLIVPTYEIMGTRGENKGKNNYLPRQVASFLNIPSNREKMVGIIGAGNRNFYDEFAFSADVVSRKTGVPILYRIELAGSEEDVINVKEGLNRFWETTK